MRAWLAVGIFCVVSTLAAPASAQSFAIEIDLLPAIEGLGLGVLGALDYGTLLADAVTAASEGTRRRPLADTEIALGVLDLLGAIPAWWQWTEEQARTRGDMALAAPLAMTITGAILVAVGASYYALAPPRSTLRLDVAPSADGALVRVMGRF